jgi:hypothetical protein
VSGTRRPGSGYHDHNWGNVGLIKVVHDWYWARGGAGSYSVIASYITAAKEYEFEPIPIFMLARDNAVIGGDPAKVTFERDGVYTDQATGKPVAPVTRYTYTDGEDRYVVSFTRTYDLSDTPMIDSIKGVKRIAAKLARFDGAYLRFAGDIEIARCRGGRLAETHHDDAIWELMYLGHTRDRPVHGRRALGSAGSAAPSSSSHTTRDHLAAVPGPWPGRRTRSGRHWSGWNLTRCPPRSAAPWTAAVSEPAGHTLR